jgi:two-component system chemotaxis sensor kinase CheA
MSIELSQFFQVFFEESFEGLDVMESGLMSLDTENVDNEMINSIFRAAHSIKGGSATFGFSSVAEFTHVLETLLDEVRSETRGINTDMVDLFLQSVDCLRELLHGLQAEEPVDTARAKDLREKFEAYLDVAPGAEADSNGVAAPAGLGWNITFNPGEDILRTGNEPLRMFTQLAELGELTVETNISQLPAFSAITLENCYFTWQLTLMGKKVTREQIDEVFEWVVDECEIIVEPIVDEAASAAAATAAATVAAANAAVAAAQATAAVAPVAAVAPAAPVAAGQKKAEPGSIRVDIEKIDTLINMVGELVITQSMLGQIGADFTFDKVGKLQEGLQDLERNVQVLHESVMQVRMLPISFTFNRFPRMVRDLSRQLNKKIDLVVKGEQTELDKTVMEKIGDPLVHLLRNSLDHGIEKPEDRVKAGKPETGVVSLNAFHQGGNIIIEITDDGAGLPREKILAKARKNGIIGPDVGLTDEQIHDLIFQPGFSTADVVSDVSGRGVGMDVVRRNITELGGHVSVKSEEGVGSTFSISLPLTLAILDGQLVRVGDQVYIFPLVSIVESLSVDMKQVSTVAGASDLLRLREEYIPIIPLYDTFGIEPDSRRLESSLIVVVESDGVKVGLVVDELQAQQQVVIKSLETNYQSVEGVSGATILGDGTVSLILDIGGIVRLARGVAPLQVKAKAA